MVAYARGRPVHIVFVGAGAVGCFYASRLHHVGGAQFVSFSSVYLLIRLQPEQNVYVSLIARSNYAALASEGVKLETHSFGKYIFTPYAVYPSISQAALSSAPKWDYIVVTTKALPDRGDDSALIAPLVGPSSCIVLIQNGVGVEDPYRRRFRHTPIVSAVTVISAEQISSGVVRQNRWTRIHLGPYTDSAADVSGSTSSSQQSGAADDMNYVNILHAWWTAHGKIRDVEMHSELDLQMIRWHKLTINAAMNPSSILSGGLGPAAMISDPELAMHLRGVMEEVWVAAAKILGRPFPTELATPERILASAARNKEGRPSMLLDWESGRPLEVEVILGNPVRMARARGVDMPKVQAMYSLLRSMMREREAEKQSQTPGRL
jgi:2-dehydropantoate 2-reductase